MTQKIKLYLLSFSSLIITLITFGVSLGTAYAFDTVNTPTGAPSTSTAPASTASTISPGAYACGGTQGTFGSVSGCANGGGSTSGLANFLTWAVNIFSAIVGLIAVVMIIVGGLKYITSGGDSTKVGSAKNTLLYAIIGLVIVVLAQVIVHFVLGEVKAHASGVSNQPINA